jgi:hypothetical protein
MSLSNSLRERINTFFDNILEMPAGTGSPRVQNLSKWDKTKHYVNQQLYKGKKALGSTGQFGGDLIRTVGTTLAANAILKRITPDDDDKKDQHAPNPYYDTPHMNRQ